MPRTGLFAGASYGLSNLTNGFADRTVDYTSPSLVGITMNTALYIDTDSDDDYSTGSGYRGRGIDAGIQYYDAAGGQTWAKSADVNHGRVAPGKVLRPAARRKALDVMRGVGLNERRTCGLIGISRTTYRYVPLLRRYERPADTHTDKGDS